MATVPYTGHPTPEVKAAAAREAKLNALDRYIAESNPAKQRIFDSAHDRLVAALDNYVLNSIVLSETDDAKSKTYTVVLKVEINGSRFENALSDASGSSPSRPSGQQVAAIFVARTPNSVQKFDDRVYKRKDVTLKATASSGLQKATRDSDGVHGGGVSTGGRLKETASLAESASATNETGGSVTRKADAVIWSVANASDVDQEMTGIFANAGMEVVPADFIDHLDLAAVRRDFGTGNDLSSQTLRGIVAAVRASGVPILVLGWIDEQMPDVDPISGNARIYVKVNARVYDVSGSIPRVLSSIGPVQYAGLGPSGDVAAANAIRIAADDAAKKLVDEISVKGIR
jgi:hypothetical protein